jgi:hypothetical protein
VFEFRSQNFSKVTIADLGQGIFLVPNIDFSVFYGRMTQFLKFIFCLLIVRIRQETKLKALPFRAMSFMKEQLIELMHSGKLELISTHEHLSLPVIERIHKKMTLKLLFGSIQVAENVIINGHHRYLASMLANYTLE